jgi:hypothetical protein
VCAEAIRAIDTGPENKAAARCSLPLHRGLISPEEWSRFGSASLWRIIPETVRYFSRAACRQTLRAVQSSHMSLVVGLLLVFLIFKGAKTFWFYIDNKSKAEDRACANAQSWLESELSFPSRVPVDSVSWGNDGRDIHMSLSQGARLRLRCFWPRRVEVTHLIQAVFNDELGWIIDAEVPNGDRVRFYAWRVMYSRS